MSQDPFEVFQVDKKRAGKQDVYDFQQTKKKIHASQKSTGITNPMALLQAQMDAQEKQVESEVEEALIQSKLKLQNIQIEMESTEDGCIHQVFYPKNYERAHYDGPYNAKKYQFKLDPFQAKSVHAIECDQSVLVCAHTSAGKTAVAQYAIAKSLKNNSRVIYTSPIKALSNQKYRQLKDQFNDVGLITGDASIDKQATCLVMTTQILRNMIFKGSQIVRQVKWVIFDEVHYMRDKQRGVVWQQTIIMLPSSVKFVFLSATIGNPGQFATWITKLRNQPCNVVYTDYRPVPLEHYLCPANGQGLFLVVDQKGKFLDDQFSKAVQGLGDTVTLIGADKKNKKNLNQGSDLNKVIKVIIERNLDPVIIFSFSKKQVQAFAKAAVVKYDLTTKVEKQRITQIFTNAVNALGQDSADKKLPQITCMLNLLLKGIGLHHGGLLPFLKEVIELLFQEGYLKILFSTQTFSMGLNMPARTVVFTSIKKWDGEQVRWITGGQYIQMSGRAGRRGKDKKGVTILMVDEKLQTDIAISMLKGKSDDLNSSFHISYNMLLNSQRLEDVDADYILSRSFLQFQHEQKMPVALQAHKKKQQQLKNLTILNEQSVQKLFYGKQRIKQYEQKIHKLTFKPKQIVNYLCVGRVVKVKDGKIDWNYGVVLNFNKKEKHSKFKADQANDLGNYVVDMMVYVKHRQGNQQPKPAKFTQEGQMVVLMFSMNCIQQITALKLPALPNDLNSTSAKNAVHKTLLKATLNTQIQLIKIGQKTPQVVELNNLIKQCEKQIAKYKIYEDQLQDYAKKRQIYQQVKQSAAKLKQFTGIVLRKQKKAYSRVIKRGNLVEKGVVTLKGSVACQISSGHQILLTELIFSGFFSEMQHAEIAAVLSSLVHQQRSHTDKKFNKNQKIRAKLQQLINHAKQLYKVFRQCKIPLQQEQYLESIKQQLVEVALQWCNGASFQTICTITDSYQGTIVRTLRRLHQLLNQMSKAATVVGNAELSTKFNETAAKIYRGLVSAASLYLV